MITAIISEFNPITNGHKHIIKKASENGDTVICIMSGNFVQRGEGSILPKHVRAKMAVLAGADMVCELPVHFSCCNAETFAFGAMKLISQIKGVDKVLFGSECGNITRLQAQADFSEDKYFKKSLSKNLAKGTTFAKAKSDTHLESGSEFSLSPNDVLGVEYIRAGKKVGFKGEFETIKRIGSDHDSENPQGEFASASFIRSCLLAGDTEKARQYMPAEAFELLLESDIVDCSSLGVLASYQGIFGKEREDISEVSEGLENLMFQNDFDGFSEYAMKIKSKRYTLARIKRMSVKSVLNITKSDVKFAKKHVKFLKVLAVKKERTDLFSQDLGIKLIKRTKDIQTLGKKQKKILSQMQKSDLVYSIFSKEVQLQMEVVEGRDVGGC